jgi:TolB-like protein/class 3 adenylate cyclase/Flp pilus assembly protein TadD
MVVDLMESVRLIQQAEEATIDRWIQFTRHVQQNMLADYGARCVKSLGDGLLLELIHVPPAAPLAAALHGYFEATNQCLAPDQQMWLRIGCHWCEVFQGDNDIYGQGVNLAARIASYAGPGNTMVSINVHDKLINGIDADLIDQGECYLKHIDTPVRIYQMQPLVPRKPASTEGTIGGILDLATTAPLVPPKPTESVTPKIAVIPFESRGTEQQHLAIGDLIADGIIAMLSRTAQLHVVSRLSATRLRNRGFSSAEQAQHLQASYLLSGSYYSQNGKVIVQAELVRVHNERIIWADRLRTPLADLFELNSELCGQIAAKVHQALLDFEVQNALTQPLPNLQSYSLLLSGLHLIHQASPQSFSKGQAVLEHLVERHPRSAQAHTWNATLHMLRTTRGLVQDIKKEAALALRHTYEALAVEPENALALATQGIVYCHINDDPDTAYQHLSKAVTHNPNCALAWLYLATVQSLRGHPTQAVECGEQALKLSPVDPQAYYYESLYGSALLVNGQSTKACEVLASSLKKNCYHAPTIRMLIVAQVESGKLADAQTTMKYLLNIEPALTGEKYLARSKANVFVRQRFMHALISAGLPYR